MKRKKIVRIINRLTVGGPLHHIKILSEGLDSKYDTTIITGSIFKGEISLISELTKRNIKVIKVKEMCRGINPVKDFIAYYKIRRILKKIKPQIVHTHASKSGALGRLAAHHEKIPKIFHTFHGHVFHSYFSSIITNLFIYIERYLATITNKIIVISESQKNDIVNIFKISKNSHTALIPLGFNLEKFSTNRSIKRKKFRNEFNINNEIAIAIVGRLVKIKNHIFFLKIIHKFLNRNPEINLKVFIIGDGEEKSNIINFLKENNIEYSTKNSLINTSKVFLTSWRNDIDSIMAGIDLLCMCSKNEGTPVSIIEAVSSKTPFITNDVGGINDIFDKRYGVKVKANSFNEYYREFEKLISNKKYRESFVKSDNSDFVKKYSSLRLIDDISNIYRQ